MGKKKETVSSYSPHDKRAFDLYEKNKRKGKRPFKTRNRTGERPIGLRQQRAAKKKGSE